MGKLATSNIFISYRREDSAAYAGRICDHLTAVLGESRVFMDVEDISPGQNFAQRIDQTIGTCGTMLVIIGPKWLAILDERLKQDHEDYVRHEIESALRRKTTVIPVLVGGAVVTELTGLPPTLAELSFHQTVELRDTSFKEDCDRLAKSLGTSAISKWKTPLLALAALGIIAALLFLLFSKYGVSSWGERAQIKNDVTQLFHTAQTETKLGEYEAAYRTSTQAVKLDPRNPATINRQVDAAMLWLEHYSIVAKEGTNSEDQAAEQLAELMAVLDGGLARTNEKESRSADILAHIGWAHWLNRHIAQKEFGPLAEQSFRQALAIEPSNVYANAMLGNWLLQTRGSVAEAIKCFSTAIATGRERALVRTMELGGMLYNDADGIPREAVKVLNDMRKNNEPVAEAYRSRFLSSYFDPNYSDEFLKSVLTAVPPEETWQTYLWLDDSPLNDDSGSDYRQLKRELIQAKVLELGGRKTEAIAAYKALQQKLKERHMTGRIAEHVADALAK